MRINLSTFSEAITANSATIQLRYDGQAKILLRVSKIQSDPKRTKSNRGCLVESSVHRIDHNGSVDGNDLNSWLAKGSKALENISENLAIDGIKLMVCPQ